MKPHKPQRKAIRAWALFSPTSGKIIETDGKPWIAMNRKLFTGEIFPSWRKYIHRVEIRPLPRSK